MIDRKTVFEIHRFKNAGYSARQIAGEMRLGRDTVKKYLENPEATVARKKPKVSKLDTYCDLIDSFLEEYPLMHAPVILQRIQEKGFDGRITIVRDYLRKQREKALEKQTGLHSLRVRSGQTDADRLGTLRCSLLWGNQAKALRLGGHRILQPDALCPVYPQPETGGPPSGHS